MLAVTDNHLQGLAGIGVKADGFCMLVTAERTFDAGGRLRLASDERMSTLLTPTGLPVEGGVQGAVTNRFGYGFRTPVDLFQTVPLGQTGLLEGGRQARFDVEDYLPPDLPPGIYRVRVDFGVTAGRRYYSLNGEAFARRPFFTGRPVESHVYSPPIRADGADATGRDVDASTIRPRISWVLLNNYNSNGYRGVVAEEDKDHFGISGRNLIQDDVILPLFDDLKRRVSYTLEPQFPTDTIELRNNIPWDYAKGELSVQVTGPDGKTADLGTWPFVGKTGQWPTTRKSAITAWRPPGYGQYTVRATGWTEDIWGNRYEGGGTYKFWIAKRMTLATATFQGMAYPVGNRYGRDMGFAPAVPADVEVTATLYPDSDPKQAHTVVYSGKASPSGLFTSAQGLKPLNFDAPGEYAAHVLAKYVDKDDHLWVCSMRHAGVVYPEDSPIVAHGKKVTIEGKLFDRGETHFEGWVETDTGVSHLAHLNFPYNSGDVLLLASDGQGANKIEPVLTYERKGQTKYDPRWQAIGVTNVQLKTSNGYSPHLFPEYITDWAYYYGGAPRPGFMSRFLVAEDGTRAPYWPTSPNSFGGQINASPNGDMPGDIYRLIGGVVLRPKDQAPVYAGYLASAFLLPRGSNNNRVVGAGDEELTGSDGVKSRIFLVGTRPGMLYETGTTFAPALQIDPVLPVNVTFTLRFPDGRSKTWTGTGDKFGGFAAADRITMDVAGIYHYTLDAEWNGHKAHMPGLPPDGGDLYVIEKDRPADATGLALDLPEEKSFPATGVLTITGSSTASTVYFAAVIPGCVIDQGNLKVANGRFLYTFDPNAVNLRAQTYDIKNRITQAPDIKEVVHLTFFSEETSPGGQMYHSFVRLIIRGNRVLYTR